MIEIQCAICGTIDYALSLPEVFSSHLAHYINRHWDVLVMIHKVTLNPESASVVDAKLREITGT
jgi:hypothetical protein